MSRVLSGNKLIDSVRKRSMAPDDTSVFTDQDILDIANEELDVQLLDKLLSLHEEHLTTHIDIPMNSKGIYDIPYRSIGNKIRDISLVSGSQSNPVLWELSQVSIGELPDYTYSSTSTHLDLFYVESNQIKLINPSTSYNFIRIYFYIRPNYLTKLESAAKISNISIDQTLGTVTFNFINIPSTFSTETMFDFIGNRTPNKIKGFDITPISIDISLKTIIFSLSNLEDILSDIKIGDYLTKAEESPFPNIPTEMHPLLAQLTAIHILEATGDSEGLSNALSRFEKMNKSVMQLVDDRVELAPKKIKPRHGTLNDSITRSNPNKRRGI